MPHAYPAEITREFDRNPWRHRPHIPALRRPHNDNHAGGGHCPACHQPSSRAPNTSEYRGKGIIHHHWLCSACGHEWITVLQAPG